MTVYCATSNKGKLREFQLAAPDFDVRALPNPVPPPDETGDTFEANAILKAVAYGENTAGYLFADDSGLEVDALNGAPGVHSARYAGEHATDAANNELLLANACAASKTAAHVSCASSPWSTTASSRRLSAAPSKVASLMIPAAPAASDTIRFSITSPSAAPSAKPQSNKRCR